MVRVLFEHNVGTVQGGEAEHDVGQHLRAYIGVALAVVPTADNDATIAGCSDERNGLIVFRLQNGLVVTVNDTVVGFAEVRDSLFELILVLSNKLRCIFGVCIFGFEATAHD